MASESKMLPVEKLKKFVADVFEKSGVSRRDSEITADVLVTSDRRGIASHGVARLKRYTDGIKRNVMVAGAKFEILRENPTTLLATGNDGLGQPMAYYAMEKVIEKAKKNGVAFGTVRNSNHYGIAAYYSMMALSQKLIGISLTNSAPLGVPTLAKSMFIGTNPISVAAPTNKERPWVLDMATTTVPRGKLEVYRRADKKMPMMWATDASGIPTDDPAPVLQNMLDRVGGGLLPLGGGTEETGGHKGYGLSMLVDVLSGVLSGGSYGLNVYGKGKEAPADVCHFFGAIDPACFVPYEQFTQTMDNYIQDLHNMAKADGQDRIWVHGEKEWLKQEAQTEQVAIEQSVIDTMKGIADELAIEFPF